MLQKIENYKRAFAQLEDAVKSYPAAPQDTLYRGWLEAEWTTQGAVRICFGLLFRVKFILGKGLGLVLPCICRNGCGVQTNK